MNFSIYKNKENNYYLKLNLFDKNDKPLKTITINSILLYSSDNFNKKFDVNEPISLLNNTVTSNLEYTPKNQLDMNNNCDYYYAIVNLIGDVGKLFVAKYYKLKIELQIKNIFNVVTKQTYFLLLDYKKNINGKNISVIPEITHVDGSEDYYEMTMYHSFTNYDSIEYVIENKES